jgi:hypothetical protein
MKKLASFSYTMEDVDQALKDENIAPIYITAEMKEQIAKRAMDFLTEECHKAMRDAVKVELDCQ